MYNRDLSSAFSFPALPPVPPLPVPPMPQPQAQDLRALEEMQKKVDAAEKVAADERKNHQELLESIARERKDAQDREMQRLLDENAKLRETQRLQELKFASRDSRDSRDSISSDTFSRSSRDHNARHSRQVSFTLHFLLPS